MQVVRISHFFHSMNTEKRVVNILIPFLLCKSFTWNKIGVSAAGTSLLLFCKWHLHPSAHYQSFSTVSVSSGANWRFLWWALNVQEMLHRSPDICRCNFWLAYYSLSILAFEHYSCKFNPSLYSLSHCLPILKLNI